MSWRAVGAGRRPAPRPSTGLREAAQGDLAVGYGVDARRAASSSWSAGMSTSLGPGGVAQPGGEVDGRADVVVALEQQGVAAGDADPQRQRGAHLAGPLVEVEGGGDAVGLVDGDDHAAVAEPLGDAHATVGGDLAGDGCGRRERRHAAASSP